MAIIERCRVTASIGSAFLLYACVASTEGDPEAHAGLDAAGAADRDGGVELDADGDDRGDSVTPCEGGDFDVLPVGGPVALGGGPRYANLICREDSDVVVSSLEELRAELEVASTGDVVFLAPDAELDTGYDANLEVPPGVTLSGGRGCDCRQGALLYTNESVQTDYDHETVLRAQEGSRITGLRIRGPRQPYEWITLDEMNHYLDGKAIGVSGADVEIDNNELWGFAHAGISAGLRTHVHHNHIHNMVREGLGYGVNSGDDVVIEYNYFDWLRHAVASGGRRSYVARYNHMGRYAISHIFDMHKDGGGTIEIYRNTVEAVDHQLKSKNVPGVVIRGTPSDTADIYENWFFNPKPPRVQPIDQWTDEAIVQMHVTDWKNVTFRGNHYGEDSPGACTIGAPREGCPAP